MPGQDPGLSPADRGEKRQSLYRAGWLLYGVVCLIPYLTSVYLILDAGTSVTGRLIGVFFLTLILIVAGAIMIRRFASRLRYVARIIDLNVHDGGTEKLPLNERDVEEVYMLTRDFNVIVDELEQQKKHAKKLTARMLAYVNDLDAYEKKLAEELLIRANLSRYVGQDVVDELVRNQKQGFENVECMATILFADIRQFTTLSEDLEPEEVITLLNSYFATMVPIVFKYEGTLDKFIGDELMAVFRDHPYGERASLRAIRAGIEITRAVETMGKQAGSHASRLEIGIGINTGKVVIGNVGSENRKDYTAIGDTVNVAARLEKIAGGQEIIVGEATYRECKDQIPMEEKGEIVLKNRKSPVLGYRVLLQLTGSE